jgi:thiamine-monophosphate kinase
MRLSDLGEFGLIDRINSMVGLPGGRVIKGIGDDCAVIESSGDKATLLTTDMLVEGIHFRREFISPEKLGRKALAVNISDIAAMGGKPLCALLALAVPRQTEVEYINQIVSGIISMAGETGVEFAGGDLSQSPEQIIINLFLTGEVSRDKVVYRSGAGPKQTIFVTGHLGSSAAGLDILNRGIKMEKYAQLVDAHISPRPHLLEGETISSSSSATSLIDISDGLLADLEHICRESNVGAVIRQAELPISDSCRQYCADFKLNPLDFALHGGEDYVLLGTVPEHSFYKLKDLMKSKGCSINYIGKTTEEPGIRLQDESGVIRAAGSGGYDHFKNRPE